MKNHQKKLLSMCCLVASVLGISAITSFGHDNDEVLLSNTSRSGSAIMLGFKGKGNPEMRGAIGFTTPAKNYNLTDITMIAERLSGDDAKDILVTLYSDNLEKPGTPIALPLKLVKEDRIPSDDLPLTSCMFVPAVPIKLLANTPYWVVLAVKAPSQGHSENYIAWPLSFKAPHGVAGSGKQVWGNGDKWQANDPTRQYGNIKITGKVSPF